MTADFDTADRAASGGTARALGDTGVYALLAALGVALWWMSGTHAGSMPAWAPWDFSWGWFAAAALALWWYGRGLLLAPAGERPAAWRSLSYVFGVLSIYAVLQTHFEYLAEHMFFLNRVQHIAMHHFGPFFIALAWPGETVKRGMPAFVRRLIAWRPLVLLVRIIQQPVLATFLFVGLVILWLIPDIHFRAMIDPKLYAVMNWSMVVDGVLFWVLVLDPRPKPPARVSFAGRAAMVFAVVPPQLVLGAFIVFSPHDLYSFYDWCGRIFPGIDALADQQLGGLNIWIPPSMMSIAGFILVINALRLHEEKQNAGEEEDDGNRLVVHASRWTGN